MITKSKKRCLFLCLLISIAHLIFAQKIENHWKYQLPKILIYSDLKDIANSSQVKLSEQEHSNQDKGYDIVKFYPIGWSKDGRIAFIEYVSNSAVEFWELNIQSLVNDSIVFSEQIHDSYDLHPNQPTINLAYIWEENKDTFEKALNRYQIIQQDSFLLLPYPIITEHDNLWINVTYTEADLYEDLSYSIEGHLQLDLLLLNTQKSKTIYKGDHLAMGMDLPGYLKSPFEERVAILLATITPGQHFSPPHEVRFQLIGAHLLDGFKK